MRWWFWYSVFTSAILLVAVILFGVWLLAPACR